jgi:alkanesulfonate monooxygenase SsuD/methylene tetrahydromethanopterin reductase-like flavin-dependent oxidoreductase (luciferase family)
MRDGMQVGVLAGRFTVGEYDLLLDSANAADEAGFDIFYRSDHHLSLEGDHDRPVTEAWVTLAGLARETRSIRLGVLVSPAIFRHPTLLARMAATVDRMSGGRLEVGLGAGGYPPDREIMGLPRMPLSARYNYLREYAECLQGLWRSTTFDYAGEFFSYHGVRLEPRPLQPGGPPLILGGKGTPEMVAMAARLGLELNLDFPSLERTGEVLGLMNEHRGVGQPRVSVEIHPPASLDPQETAKILDAYASVGIRKTVFFLPPSDQPTAAIAKLGAAILAWRQESSL